MRRAGSLLASFPMSTIHEIKAAAATLSADQRNELVTWLSESEDVLKIRHEQLRRDIQIGLDQIERGETAPFDMEEIRRKACGIIQC